jgi:hypothetical protein
MGEGIEPNSPPNSLHAPRSGRRWLLTLAENKMRPILIFTVLVLLGGASLYAGNPTWLYRDLKHEVPRASTIFVATATSVKAVKDTDKVFLITFSDIKLLHMTEKEVPKTIQLYLHGHDTKPLRDRILNNPLIYLLSKGKGGIYHDPEGDPILPLEFESEILSLISNLKKS